MTKRCDRAGCFPEMPCILGEASKDECPHYSGEADAAATAADQQPSDDAILFPWTGNSLGTADMPFVTGRSAARMISLIGPQDAGKTTILASWYLLMGRGRAPAGRSFAGSYTLTGWENIAHALRWDGTPPSFPPHTTSGSGRVPGQLHLALRSGNRTVDYLFADSPGEWFRRWSISRDAPDAEGARWVNERADVILVLADCAALSGADRGQARVILQNLLHRVGAEARTRPVALVWSKSDLQVAEALRKGLQETARRLMPGIVEFSVSVTPKCQNGTDPTGLLTLLEWVAAAPLDRAVSRPEPLLPNDPFHRYGFALS
ncbi:TRAFAC clade GTPase domain-containing protein [Methylobacterium sp. D54C]